MLDLPDCLYKKLEFISKENNTIKIDEALMKCDHIP